MRTGFNWHSIGPLYLSFRMMNCKIRYRKSLPVKLTIKSSTRLRIMEMVITACTPAVYCLGLTQYQCVGEVAVHAGRFSSRRPVTAT